MSESLSREVQNRIEKFVKTLSVNAELNREFRKELHGHFEDQMLAYLSGNEPVTEDDAFILVKISSTDWNRSKIFSGITGKKRIPRRFSTGLCSSWP